MNAHLGVVPVDNRVACVRYAVDEYGYGGVDIKGDDIVEVTRFEDWYESIDYRVDGGLAAVVRLRSGKWAAVEGGYGCETGWSCQAHLYVTVCDTEDEAWLNLTVEGRGCIERREAS